MPEARVFANRYELGEAIGQGGMADVYLARDRLLDRQVAVKVLSPEFASDPTNFERFRREARAAAGLNHPNIVAVYDWGEEDDTSFIVMEYVPGQTLGDFIRSYGRLPPTEAALVAAEIADALSFAHAHGVVHRDVKPGNVLITPQGQVKVTDFGIARAETGDPLTKAGSVVGTAAYFSPEQAQGLDLDGRSDVYALGVVLYEMVTGAAPFTAASPVSLAYKHVREAPAAPSTIVPDLPGAMDRIVLTAMAKDVHARYQSAQDLRGDLLRFERGRPLVGGPLTAAAAEIPTTVVAAPVAASTRRTPAPGPVDPARTTQRRASWGPIVAVGIALALLLAPDRGAPRAIRLRCGRQRRARRSTCPGWSACPTGRPKRPSSSSASRCSAPTRTLPTRRPTSCSARIPSRAGRSPKGGLITLTVSSATITMPDVVGQTREAAAANLAKVNLATRVRRGRERPTARDRAGDLSGSGREGQEARLRAGDRERAGRRPTLGARRGRPGPLPGRAHTRRRRVPGDGRADPERHRAQGQGHRHRSRGRHAAPAGLGGEAPGVVGLRARRRAQRGRPDQGRRRVRADSAPASACRRAS